MKTIVILSGGVDSTVILWECLTSGLPTKAISFDYGQRHRKELDAARTVAGMAGVEHKVASLTEWGDLMRNTALAADGLSVPHGHYEDPLQKTTVVPNRNMVFLAVAASWAMATGYERVAIGAHLGDRAIYPDCREEFLDAMTKALSLADHRQVAIWRPFVAVPKSEVVRRGKEIGAPLDLTWTCYEGGDEPCGQCGACVERVEAEGVTA